MSYNIYAGFIIMVLPDNIIHNKTSNTFATDIYNYIIGPTDADASRKPPGEKATGEKDADEKQFAGINTKLSFTITFVLLITMGALTFIEALRTKDNNIRHILNLFTCIAIASAAFYYNALAYLRTTEQMNQPVIWADLSKYRYVDFAITTPLSMLILCIFLASNTHKKIHIYTLGAILLLDYAILSICYLGEFSIHPLTKWHSILAAIIPFSAMFWMIYSIYVEGSTHYANYIMYSAYVLVWSKYSLAYLLDDYNKNITYNVLDIFSKCAFGIGTWLYYTKTIVI